MRALKPTVLPGPSQMLYGWVGTGLYSFNISTTCLSSRFVWPISLSGSADVRRLKPLKHEVGLALSLPPSHAFYRSNSPSSWDSNDYENLVGPLANPYGPLPRVMECKRFVANTINSWDVNVRLLSQV